MNYFVSLIKQVDYFGEVINLEFNREKKFKSILGGALTLFNN